MNRNPLAKAALCTGTIALAASVATGPALAHWVSPSSGTHRTSPRTPDQCIRLNHGDYNACNVGNSGRGDLPYQPAARPPAHPGSR